MQKFKQNFRFSPINMPYMKSIGLVVLVLILALVPIFMDDPYFLHLLITAGMNATLAMTFILLLRVGLIALTQAAFWGIGAYASAILVMRLGLPFWLALPAAGIIAGIVGLLLGFVVVRVTGFGFLLQTAVFSMVIVLVFGNLDLFGGYVGLVEIPRPNPITLPFIAKIEFVGKAPYYYLMLFLFVLVSAVLSAFYAAWTGRSWRAIGLSPRLAESLGVNLFRYRLLAFVIMSVICGLIGSFYAHFFGALTPNTFNIFKTINIHIYAILGGLDFVLLGPAIGALILTIVPEILRVAKEVEPIFTGALIILLILFLPGGLLSLGRGIPRASEGIARAGKWMKAVLRGSKEV